MEILTINLGATETKQFRHAGSYFEILESVGAIGVRFSSVLGGQINSIDGGLSGLYLNTDFGAFDITNQYGTAQQIKVLLCDAGEDGGSRRQPGNVRIIDNNVDKTRAGAQFVAAPALNGVAGVFSIVTVYPTAKSAAIKRLLVSSSTAGTIYLGTGTGAPTANPVAQGGMRNKLIGGAVSDLQRALGTCAAQPPTTGEVPGYSGLFTLPVAANTYVEVPLTTPIVLGPGQYLVVVGAAINSNVSALIDWEEF